MLSFPEEPHPKGSYEQGEADKDELPEIDLHALAEEILALLKEELREENERAGRSLWR